MIRSARRTGAATPSGLAATPAGGSGGIDLAEPTGVYLAQNSNALLELWQEQAWNRAEKLSIDLLNSNQAEEQCEKGQQKPLIAKPEQHSGIIHWNSHIAEQEKDSPANPAQIQN